VTKSAIHLHVGSLEEMGARFVAAWKAAERGRKPARDHLTFLSLEAFMTAISPRRFELMRHLRRVGPMSVRRLAGELSRDYKSVHREVAMMTAIGLIERRAADEVAMGCDPAGDG